MDRELKSVQVRVEAILREKGVVRSGFDDSPAIKGMNDVGVLDRR